MGRKNRKDKATGGESRGVFNFFVVCRVGFGLVGYGLGFFFF